MTRILVTGGCGFIGSNFINYWLRSHSEDYIVNLDKMTYAADESYIDRKLTTNNYELIRGDIANKELVLSICENVDIIINFAAESHVDNSIMNPSPFIDSNYVGVFNLLEATRRYGLRFHQVSTDEVYGSVRLDSKEKFYELSCYHPGNPYSATKAVADLLVKAYFNSYGIKATISNCTNNDGPNQHPEKLIPKAILNALLNCQIPIYGEGNQVRDWIFVKDHITALELILEKGRMGETYLISAENEKSNLDIVPTILHMTGKSKELLSFVKDRPRHDVKYSLDSKKVREELHWVPCN